MTSQVVNTQLAKMLKKSLWRSEFFVCIMQCYIVKKHFSTLLLCCNLGIGLIPTFFSFLQFRRKRRENERALIFCFFYFQWLQIMCQPFCMKVSKKNRMRVYNVSTSSLVRSALDYPGKPSVSHIDLNPKISFTRSYQ